MSESSENTHESIEALSGETPKPHRALVFLREILAPNVREEVEHEPGAACTWEGS
jgi:hypothetical protein